MRHVDGYVFIAQFDRISPLFGRRVDETSSEGDYDTLELNGLEPYQTQEDALQSAQDFESKREDCKGTKVARIGMKIAEDADDLKLLREEESLIVIMYAPENHRLIGPYDPKKGAGESPLPGTRLTQNGFVTFVTSEDKSAYDQAEYLASEVSRQGDSPATLATFLLEEIS